MFRIPATIALLALAACGGGSDADTAGLALCYDDAQATQQECSDGCTEDQSACNDDCTDTDCVFACGDRARECISDCSDDAQTDRDLCAALHG